MREYINIQIDLVKQLKKVYPVDETLDAKTKFLNCRNHVIFRLMLETGITPLEIEKLTWVDFIAESWKDDLITKRHATSERVNKNNSNVWSTWRSKKWHTNLIESIDRSIMIGEGNGGGERQLKQRKVRLSKGLVLLLEKLLTDSLKRQRVKNAKVARQMPVICSAGLGSNQHVVLTKDAISNLVSMQSRDFGLQFKLGGVQLHLTSTICRQIALLAKGERLLRSNAAFRDALQDFSGVSTWRSISDLAVNPIYAGTSAPKLISRF